MELNVVESKKNRLIFEFKGADHTFSKIKWEKKLTALMVKHYKKHL